VWGDACLGSRLHKHSPHILFSKIQMSVPTSQLMINTEKKIYGFAPNLTALKGKNIPGNYNHTNVQVG